MLKISYKNILLHSSRTCFAAVVLSFGMPSPVGVIPRSVLWAIPGIRLIVSSRSVLEHLS
jgi:hypothetical protein